MPFKIASKVSIFSSEPYQPNVEHIILSKERELKRGEVLKFEGGLARDPEAKYYISATGELRVIDENTIGLTWTVDRRKSWPYGWKETSGEPRYFKEKEMIITGSKKLDMSDAYHSNPAFNEIFTFLERLRIPFLIEKTINNLPREEIKTVKRETKIWYEEPTLPPQSRK